MIYREIIKYINYGYAIFPVYSSRNKKCTCKRLDCKNPGKHPISESNPQKTVSNIQEVNRLKDLWINSNIGIATGKISNIIVLDIDPRDGGDILLRELIYKYSELPETVTAMSGGNGLHYYFKYPKFEIPTCNALRSGIDFKSDNDWIIAPPSLHISGQKYKWKKGFSPEEIALAQLPEWLSDLVLEKSSLRV